MKPVPGMKPLLLIGYGNPLRQDDGLGWCIAIAMESLGLPGLQVVATQQLTLELATPIAMAENVVFVDATYGDSATPPPPPVIEPLCFQPQAPDLAPQALSHQLTPQVLLLLAGQLYGHQPAALQLLVPGQWDGHGEGFSPIAAAAMARAITLLVGWAQGDGRGA